MLTEKRKILMVAMAVALAPTPMMGRRPTAAPAPRRVHHARAWHVEDGCRELPAPARPLPAPPPPSVAAATCS